MKAGAKKQQQRTLKLLATISKSVKVNLQTKHRSNFAFFIISANKIGMHTMYKDDNVNNER